jgi:hypothetical protein
MIRIPKRKPLTAIKEQLEANKNPTLGETDKEFLIRKGVIKRG